MIFLIDKVTNIDYNIIKSNEKSLQQMHKKVHGHPAVSRAACSQSGSCISPAVKRKQTYKHQGLGVHTWKEVHPVSIEINVAFSGERNG